NRASAADAGDHSIHDEPKAQVDFAQRHEVSRQDNQRRHRDDDFRHGEFEEIEVAHGVLLNQSNSGELKLGTMMSSRMRGNNPMASDTAINSSAPSFSGNEIGGIGSWGRSPGSSPSPKNALSSARKV